MESQELVVDVRESMDTVVDSIENVSQQQQQQQQQGNQQLVSELELAALHTDMTNYITEMEEYKQKTQAIISNLTLANSPLESHLSLAKLELLDMQTTQGAEKSKLYTELSALKAKLQETEVAPAVEPISAGALFMREIDAGLQHAGGDERHDREPRIFISIAP